MRTQFAYKRPSVISRFLAMEMEEAWSLVDSKINVCEFYKIQGISRLIEGTLASERELSCITLHNEYDV